jgi:hypothetical protein
VEKQPNPLAGREANRRLVEEEERAISKSDEFTVKVVEKPEDIKRLAEAGFEFYCQKDNLIFLRKRK